MPVPAVAAGFTVKSGWAAAVLLRGPAAAPRIADSRRIELSDPAVPESRQPYHAGFGTAREEGADLKRLVAGVRRYGAASVTSLLREYKAGGQLIAGAGLVAGSLTDPDSIANDHIRIHALEGQLFRGVIETATAHEHIACSLWRERDICAAGAETLGRSEQELRAELTALGAEISGPWRAEQKLAALAAWLMLAAAARRTRSSRTKAHSA